MGIQNDNLGRDLWCFIIRQGYGGSRLNYTIDDLVSLAKRDNNFVRPYLYVNPLQGKHIPTIPKNIFDVCRQIATLINCSYPNDKLYVIGFAETATGIASTVCHYLDNVVFYQNTTREFKNGEEVLNFTESHSHATNQILRITGIEEHIKEIERIIIIDDEVTTGNTICKLIDTLKQTIDTTNIHFSIASILNSMTEEREKFLSSAGIDCVSLVKIPFEYKKESIMNITHNYDRDLKVVSDNTSDIVITRFGITVDARSFCRFAEYEEQISRFTASIIDALGTEQCERILIVGTEECMYPSISLSMAISKSQYAREVKVHATTRSPIIVSDDEAYPLHYRYQLRSLYDENRSTFIYNLDHYDKVIIVTDAEQLAGGASDLVCALRYVGNDNILLAKLEYIH